MNLSRKPKLNLTENIKRLINLPTDYPQKYTIKKRVFKLSFLWSGSQVGTMPLMLDKSRKES